MTATSQPVLPPGTRLAHYEVQEVLGAGGMGTVYKAHDTSLDRPVAVKVLRSQYANEPAVVDRFVREARAAARVNHKNLAHIYFVGDTDGHRFFTMEYVPGASLDKYVKECGPVELGEAVNLLVQAAAGLAATHAAGVIHRDVKPANLIRRPDGKLKVADFGLSKSISVDVNMTGAGALVGTPTYMSPEQCRGESVDVRTDIYALGLVGYYLLTGESAFEAEAVGKVLDSQMNVPLPSIVDRRPELTPVVDQVIGRLCAKKSADRPESMNEVIEWLETIRPREVHPAPVVARASASVIDVALCGVGASILGGVVFGLTQLGVGPSVTAPFGALVVVSLWVLMLFGMELLYKTTPGKWLMHLEVVSADGTPPGAVALVLRLFLRYPAVAIPLFNMFGMDLFAASFAVAQLIAVVVGFGASLLAGRQTLSDRLTQTMVTTRIRSAAAPAL